MIGIFNSSFFPDFQGNCLFVWLSTLFYACAGRLVRPRKSGGLAALPAPDEIDIEKTNERGKQYQHAGGEIQSGGIAPSFSLAGIYLFFWEVEKEEQGRKNQNIGNKFDGKGIRQAAAAGMFDSGTDELLLLNLRGIKRKKDRADNHEDILLRFLYYLHLSGDFLRQVRAIAAFQKNHVFPYRIILLYAHSAFSDNSKGIFEYAPSCPISSFLQKTQ